MDLPEYVYIMHIFVYTSKIICFEIAVFFVKFLMVRKFGGHGNKKYKYFEFFLYVVSVNQTWVI